MKALRKVAEAHQVAKVAEAAGRQRESVYRMLSEDGNPRLHSLWAVLEAMGLRIAVELSEEDHNGIDTTPDQARKGPGSALGNFISASVAKYEELNGEVKLPGEYKIP